MSESKLLIPSAEELAACERAMTCSAATLTPEKFLGWEDELRRITDLILKNLAVELQTQNDCRANALANGEESRQFLLTGKMTQLARTYAYNACEYLSGVSQVGRDAGLSIQSGIRLITEGIKSLGVPAGLPTEESWKYGTYERSAQRFAERAKGATIVPTAVTEHGPAPTASELPVVCAVGGGVDIGVFWAPRFEQRTINGRKWKVWTNKVTRGGGHALCNVPAMEFVDGAWWPVIWNSHGDGPILMPPEVWDSYARDQFAPFGGYVLLPDKPEKKWHDRVASGGGYFRPRNQGTV